jgi:8-oxo-dGTP diphosphatase
MPDSDAPLYQRDPEQWRAHLAEGNLTQPRKRAGADALLRDARGRVMLVDPAYKPGWDFPGGMSDANEPPSETVRREIKEELGLDVQPRRLLCVDWVSPHGPWDDSLMFLFDGGVLTPGQIEAVSLADGELTTFEFWDPPHAAARLRPYVRARLTAALRALETGQASYLQDGQQI